MGGVGEPDVGDGVCHMGSVERDSRNDLME